jgi:hypothetical protein
MKSSHPRIVELETRFAWQRDVYRSSDGPSTCPKSNTTCSTIDGSEVGFYCEYIGLSENLKWDMSAPWKWPRQPQRRGWRRQARKQFRQETRQWNRQTKLLRRQIKHVRRRKEELIALHMSSSLRGAILRYCDVDAGHSAEDQIHIGTGAVGLARVTGEPPPAEAIDDLSVLLAEFVASIENTFEQPGPSA